MKENIMNNKKATYVITKQDDFYEDENSMRSPYFFEAWSNEDAFDQFLGDPSLLEEKFEETCKNQSYGTKTANLADTLRIYFNIYIDTPNKLSTKIMNLIPEQFFNHVPEDNYDLYKIIKISSKDSQKLIAQEQKKLYKETKRILENIKLEEDINQMANNITKQSGDYKQYLLLKEKFKDIK